MTQVHAKLKEKRPSYWNMDVSGQRINAFQICRLEHATAQRMQESTFEKTNIFELLWVREGSGHIQLANQQHVIEKNHIYYLAPGQLNCIRFDSPLEGFYIAFTHDFMQLSETYEQSYSWCDQYMSFDDICIIPIDSENQSELEAVAIQLDKELARYQLKRLKIVQVLFHLFVLYASTKLIKHNTSLNHEKVIFRRFRNLLRLQFISNKKVKGYASALGISASYLNAIVKKTSGFSTRHHIQQQIITEAKRLALYSGNNMKEISYKLGFESTAHFSKFFKKINGTNFTDFKQAYIETIGDSQS